MIRIVVIEDNAELRREVVDRLGGFPDMEIAGHFPSAEKAAAALPDLAPAVVLTDIQLPKRSGIDLVRDLKPKMPQTEFVMLTVFDDDNLVFEALSCGAVGYLLKRNSLEEIGAAIRDVHGGGSPMSPAIARRLVRTFQRTDYTSSEPLSPREAELLDWLVRGRSYKECADQMKVSPHTLGTYSRRLYKKLQVHSRHEAVAKVRQKPGPGR